MIANPIKDHMMERLEARWRAGDELAKWAWDEIVLGDAARERMGDELAECRAEPASEAAEASERRQAQIDGIQAFLGLRHHPEIAPAVNWRYVRAKADELGIDFDWAADTTCPVCGHTFKVGGEL